MFGGMSPHDRVPLNRFDPSGQYPRKDIYFEPSFSTDMFRESAQDFLRGRDADTPFLLYVAFTAPHDPRTPPDAFKVDPAGIDLPANFAPVHPFDNGETVDRDEQLEEFPRTPDAIRGHIADYYGMLGHLDDAIGQILATLEERGLEDDTVVIYTADHGLALGQHGLLGKQNLYEHSTHIPLILAGPGIAQGSRRPGLVWHADTMATMLDLAGLPPSPGCEGATLVGDASFPSRTNFATAYRMSQRAIRSGRFKLIRYVAQDVEGPLPTPKYPRPTPGSSLDQLFDLQADPGETVNLAFVPAFADIRRELAAALIAWQRAVDDPMLTDRGPPLPA